MKPGQEYGDSGTTGFEKKKLSATEMILGHKFCVGTRGIELSDTTIYLSKITKSTKVIKNCFFPGSSSIIMIF